MKVKLIYMVFLLGITTLQAQNRLISKNSYAKFYSHAPLEDISAENHQVSSVIDIADKEIVVKMLIKHFRFENALMEEHFNENYLESEKYPSATFKGSFSAIEEIDLGVDSKYALTTTGLMKIHGIERELTADVTLEVEGGKLIGSAALILKPKDYNIEIPSMVVKNIAEEIEVTVQLNYDIKKN